VFEEVGAFIDQSHPDLYLSRAITRTRKAGVIRSAALKPRSAIGPRRFATNFTPRTSCASSQRRAC